jgi:hypothetical protein
MTRGFTATVSVCDPHTVEVRLGGELTFEHAQDLDVLIARLHLDNRSPRVERMLTLTGTNAHFTGEVART